MHEIFFSPYVVPLGAFCVAIVYKLCHVWSAAQKQEADMQQRTLEHQEKMKSMELEIARVNAGGTVPGKYPA
ncbi:hypothetical protein [Undibacterium pigrum]|uniref:Uncharacterized protein n=1 Tax=Undibacterium pigrum TaxID=401470 RepID=A0A318IU26_9BURK|nr:hypothetical protein [Undibacterium pigrum]PXX37911.1 hypothetical protein DFR42_11471 [Undibacterium pigrum]